MDPDLVVGISSLSVGIGAAVIAYLQLRSPQSSTSAPSLQVILEPDASSGERMLLAEVRNTSNNHPIYRVNIEVRLTARPEAQAEDWSASLSAELISAGSALSLPMPTGSGGSSITLEEFVVLFSLTRVEWRFQPSEGRGLRSGKYRQTSVGLMALAAGRND